MNQKIRIALIYGSNRKGRFCDTVVRWASEQIATYGDQFVLDIIDPRALELPEQNQLEDNAGTVALQQRLSQADAFVVVTPEYNHSFSSHLKFVIDLVYSEWQAKPVSFVSYGGISGGLRAVEQLRLVFAELHAVTIRDSVSFASVWDQFSDSGELQEPKRAEKSMRNMLAKLKWWALALAQARKQSPYEQAAL